AAHAVEISFHFSEACDVWQVERSVFLAAHGTKRLCLQLDAGLTPTLYRGSEQPIAGWVSRTFDVKVPTVTLVARGRVTKTTEFRTEIWFLGASAPPGGVYALGGRPYTKPPNARMRA